MVDFVILCTGRFNNYPNIPKFPPGRGPEAFDGKVIHSMDYSKMGSEKAKEMIKDKCVTIVGYGNSALDIANECANINGKNIQSSIKQTLFLSVNEIETLVWRNHAQWLSEPSNGSYRTSMLGTSFIHVYISFVREKRLIISKFAKSYYSIPMKKHDMVPDHSFFEGMVGCMLSTTPKDHYKNL
ncbi:unnamed protein product [Triticum turgidum subsp. durum]|uniref:Flavin-containing monooxygenase n=1 Tax=Triticum turgidum subsp. durum TaxID=4567 RepID=A0A9R1BUP9_TRITD|nr:unnamed protein product [Triticum turgidum subsp. durum]